MQTQLLVVEDDAHIARLLVRLLRAERFHVDAVSTGREALAEIRSRPPDLILLDLMLPDISGWEVLEAAIDSSVSRVIIVSADDGIDSRVFGFRRGAVDYITKPFSTLEFIERVRARMKPCIMCSSGRFESDRIVVDRAARKVRIDGQSIRLSRKLFDLLAVFISRPDCVLSRSYLLERVWHINAKITTRTIDTHIGELRTVLSRFGLSGRIETIRGVGYCWTSAGSQDRLPEFDRVPITSQDLRRRHRLLDGRRVPDDLRASERADQARDSGQVARVVPALHAAEQ
jgi:DNA-binding response OmpR family regulator